MSIIKLLPENVANQIAAGEVVQRPSSVVKELLENSIDSGAQTIKLYIKDAGKTLIQVIDNGSGIDKDDLKLCCLRHATSKITNSKDLFNLKTMGFRGEALSSIASVSQITITSNCLEDSNLGNQIKIEGGKQTAFNEVVAIKGTSISVKNLFYNIPARRNFLKSDNVELKHIIDEFHRIALSNHKINFVFTNNDNELFNLNKSIFKERIIRVFGRSSEQKLIPVEENTEIAKIKGFVFKPEYSRKTRSSQFFFINGRFIKNNHLHHAIKTAYKGLILDDYHPSYFIKIDVPLETIDVNIHPNKTEVKFDNDQSIYAILISSVKHSLGQFNISPTIDFNSNVNLNTPYSFKDKSANIPRVEYDQAFNPFNNLKNPVDVKSKDFVFESYESDDKLNVVDEMNLGLSDSLPAFQLDSRYVITKNRAGLVIINQKRAQQRIMYEVFLKELSNKKNPSQTLLFPLKLEFDNSEIKYLKSIKSSLIHLGFKFTVFDDNLIEISAVHPFLNHELINNLFQDFIEYGDISENKLSHTLNDLVAKVLSKHSSYNTNVKTNQKAIEMMVNNLFACKDSRISPFGKLIHKSISLSEISNFFK